MNMTMTVKMNTAARTPTSRFNLICKLKKLKFQKQKQKSAVSQMYDTARFKRFFDF